jgi:hypothetical protein
MRRLKTKHGYHDAEVHSVEFEADGRVVFGVDLCGGPAVHLSFYGVKNIDEIRCFIESIMERAKERARIAEIIGLVRSDDQQFLLDLDQGALYIKAKGFTET